MKNLPLHIRDHLKSCTIKDCSTLTIRFPKLWASPFSCSTHWSSLLTFLFPGAHIQKSITDYPPSLTHSASSINLTSLWIASTPLLPALTSLSPWTNTTTCPLSYWRKSNNPSQSVRLVTDLGNPLSPLDSASSKPFTASLGSCPMPPTPISQ